MKFTKEIAENTRGDTEDILSHSWEHIDTLSVTDIDVFICEKCECRLTYDSYMKWGVFTDVEGERSFNSISCGSFSVRSIIL